MSKEKQKVKELANQGSTTKEFDAEAFVDGVRLPHCTMIPEWNEANYLMSIRHEMGNARLSRAEREAVFQYLELTPEEFDEALADGYAALAEARREMYGWEDEF